ncbi:hypothetical protein BC835DRAFT_1353722 [Cytidiella melzeri]|nr:hypothetical protein BC835DRAFT_1353722 [Cytidiella melzeri]
MDYLSYRPPKTLRVECAVSKPRLSVWQTVYNKHYVKLQGRVKPLDQYCDIGSSGTANINSRHEAHRSYVSRKHIINL